MINNFLLMYLGLDMHFDVLILRCFNWIAYLCFGGYDGKIVLVCPFRGANISLHAANLCALSLRQIRIYIVQTHCSLEWSLQKHRPCELQGKFAWQMSRAHKHELFLPLQIYINKWASDSALPYDGNDNHVCHH